MSHSILPDTPAIARMPVQKIEATGQLDTDDAIAVEEPLEIRLQYGPAGKRVEQGISVTMRTPGHDPELAIGFLFTEGIITDAASIISIQEEGTKILSDPQQQTAVETSNQANMRQSLPDRSPERSGRILIGLQERVSLDLGRLQRHFYTSSSCGVCGKSSLDSLRTVCPAPVVTEKEEPINPDLLHSLPAQLRQRQELFDFTGGLHASALFDWQGNFLFLREDIGRHNALDKVIGHALQQAQLPLAGNILLLSGRACFELIQKAAMAGIRVVAAVGPPSSLAVELAEEQGMTLIGFLRQERFNIYSGGHRVRV